MILLITNKDDVTTDFIVNRLNKIGEPYYRLNTEDLISAVGVNLDIAEDEYMLIDRQKNQTFGLSSIKSVYYRRPGFPEIRSGSLSEGEAEFVIREVKYLLENIYKVLNDRFWISPVPSIREAENKIYQLLVARAIGFEIPKSLITTSPDDAKAFFKKVGENCVIKPIRSGEVNNPGNPMIIFTSLLTPDNICLLDGVRECPTYLQNRVDKMADIRVTVVGKKVFAALIDSQECQETTVDWRKGENPAIRHETIELPKDIEEKCIELTKRLGLNFGAIDFVLDKDMRYTFLEINPNGQWGWIEKRLGYDISGEIVDLLLKGAHTHANFQ